MPPLPRLKRAFLPFAAAALLALAPVRPAAAYEFEAEGSVLSVEPGSMTLLSSSLDGTTRPLVFDTSRIAMSDITVGTTLSIEADTIDGQLVALAINGIDINNRGVNGRDQSSFNEGQATDDENHPRCKRKGC